jgi:hypothetical protein
MADAKHTPGPWRLDPPRMGDLNDHEYHTIEAGDGVGTDRLQGFCTSSFMSIADARLITAAPDLLEACLVIAQWAQAGQSFMYPPGSLQQITSAIAKATGSGS